MMSRSRAESAASCPSANQSRINPSAEASEAPVVALMKATTTSTTASNASTKRARVERSPSGAATTAFNPNGKVENRLTPDICDRSPGDGLTRTSTPAAILPGNLIPIELLGEILDGRASARTEAQKIASIHADDPAIRDGGRCRQRRIGHELGIGGIQILTPIHHQDDVGRDLGDDLVGNLLVALIALDGIHAASHLDHAVGCRTRARGENAPALHAEDEEYLHPFSHISGEFLGSLDVCRDVCSQRLSLFPLAQCYTR